MGVQVTSVMYPTVFLLLMLVIRIVAQCGLLLDSIVVEEHVALFSYFFLVMCM
jgi:hypothetical protein